MKRKPFMDCSFKAMRLWTVIFIISFFLWQTSQAQNLVPNPSFEGYNPCGNPDVICTNRSDNNIPCRPSCCVHLLPQSTNIINGATDNWWAVSKYPSPLYFNKCGLKDWHLYLQSINGKAKDLWYHPRTGEAQIMLDTYGFADTDTTNYRNYAQVKLIEPLTAGCIYELTSYALFLPYYIFNFATSINNSPSDGFGMYLSQDSLYTNDYRQEFQNINVTPQVSNPSGRIMSDSVHYQKISGTYKAQGGEQWLVIGNFKDNAHTQIAGNRLDHSPYAIDDVSIQLWRPDLISISDTTICADSSITLKMPDGLSHYWWSTGDTTQEITLNIAGDYTARASNGCETLEDQFTLHTQSRYNQPFSIGNDTFFCKVPNNFPLSAPSNFNTYSWSTGETTEHIAIHIAGQYKVTASYACGNLSDSILITEFKPPDTLLIPVSDTTLCSNESLDIQVYQPYNYSGFRWNDASVLPHLLVDQPGLYKLQAITPQGCVTNDSIKIDMIYPPSVHDFKDTVVCETTSLLLNLYPKPQENVLWNDGKTTSQHVFTFSGTYWVKISNVCYASTDTMKIDFIDCSLDIPNLITNNSDGKNDYFFIQTNIPRTLHLSLYNSWGTEIYTSDDYKNQWGGENVKDGIYFYQIIDPLLNKNYKGWVQVIK